MQATQTSETKKPLPLWRSALFVPANVQKYIAKARERGADAIILDLEDSVPLAEKAEARQNVVAAATEVNQAGADVLVRINQPWRLALRDIEAAVNPAVTALCIPKVSCASHIRFVDEVITELEIERGMTPGHTSIVAMIESVQALPNLDDIAGASPRLAGMILGSEDFSAAAGMQPTPETLLQPNQQLLFAARRAGILPLGFVGSIAEFRDQDKFRQIIRFSRELGFVGGFAIHPDQVTIMNEEFVPSAQEVDDAKALLAVFEQSLSQGRASAEFKGKMIDQPVVTRAREIIALQQRLTGA